MTTGWSIFWCNFLGRFEKTITYIEIWNFTPNV